MGFDFRMKAPFAPQSCSPKQLPNDAAPCKGWGGAPNTQHSKAGDGAERKTHPSCPSQGDGAPRATKEKDFV